MFQKEAGIASTGLSDDDRKWLQRAGAPLFCGVILLASRMHLSSSPLDLQASAVTRVVVWWCTESWWPGHLYLSPEVPKSYLLGTNLFPPLHCQTQDPIGTKSRPSWKAECATHTGSQRHEFLVPVFHGRYRRSMEGPQQATQVSPLSLARTKASVPSSLQTLGGRAPRSAL